MKIKRLLALMLAMIMLLPLFSAMAEEDPEILIEEWFVDENGNEYAVDENGETVYADEDDILSLFQMTATQAEELEELDLEVDDSIDPNALELNNNLPSDVVNILLIGVDTRSKDLSTGLQHNDVNMLVSINTKTGEMKMTSFLRDLYVSVVGLRNKTRLNNAYANNGGGKRTMATLNKNFELNIQYYVTINFYGLASIIDAIGGIDVDLTKTEAVAINAYLKKNPPKYDNTDGKGRVALARKAGVQHLDGVQAVMYARLREIDNDFSRTARQRHLMELLLKKVLEDMSIDTLFTLIETAMPYVTTNLNASTIMDLALRLLNSGLIERAQQGGELMSQFRIPMDKTYSYKDVNGASVVSMGTTNFPKNVKALHEFIYGEYIPAK